MKINRMTLIIIAQLISFSFASGAAESKDENAAHAIDKMIDHQMKAMYLSRSNKGKSAESEFTKFFDEMILQQEKDLKRMQELRKKLFPDIVRAPLTKEKDTELSFEMRDSFKNFEAELKTAFEKFSAKLRDGKTVANAPKIEIKEDDQSYVILAEIPGMAKDDINVKVSDNNNVMINGSRKSEVQSRGPASTSSEFEYGDYQRTIHLEKEIDPKSMTTQYKDGIVTIHLKKMAPKK